MEPINFTKLPGVTQFEALPEGAQVFIEYGGKVYRVPGAKVGGSGLPSGSSPNQYLITDSEGVAGWAERLAWKEESEKTVYDNEFAADFDGGLLRYCVPDHLIDADAFSEATSYRVIYDGAEYIVEPIETSNSYWPTCIGNPGLLSNDEGNLYPFAMGKNLQDGKFYIYPDDNVRWKLHEMTVVGIANIPHPISDDLIPDTIARTSDIPEVVQSDMAVNDPDDPAYVKNRTHWVEEVDGKTTVLEEVSGSIPSEEPGDYGFVCSLGQPSEPIVDGNTYYVTVNGKTYKRTFADFLEGTALEAQCGDVIIGYSVDSGPARNGYCYARSEEGGVDVTVEIEKDSKVPSYHPLPPSLGGMPTLAEDGSDAGKTVKANAEGTGYELATDGCEYDLFVKRDYDGTVTVIKNIGYDRLVAKMQNYQPVNCALQTETATGQVVTPSVQLFLRDSDNAFVVTVWGDYYELVVSASNEVIVNNTGV